jgi:hypothetical protein
MKKSTKTLWIVFIIGVVGLAVVAGVMIGTGYLVSRDKQETIALGSEVDEIVLNVDKAHVNIVESDESKIDVRLNLWSDVEIEAGEVAQSKTAGGVLTITETAPQNTFFGVFEQPYELIITIKVPADMADNIEEIRK